MTKLSKNVELDVGCLDGRITILTLIYIYRSGTVNSKSFVGKDLLRIKWNFELTVHFKHQMIGKHFIETSNKVELRINRVRINRARPVCTFEEFINRTLWLLYIK